jgi:ATP-dependent DNA ligase
VTAPEGKGPEAVNHLKLRSCLIDGEVVCCDEKGIAAFHVLRKRGNESDAFLYAFDLLELDGYAASRLKFVKPPWQVSYAWPVMACG